MSSNDTMSGESGVEIRTYFARERNALVARADFAPLFVEYYLHLHDCRIQRNPAHDAVLRDALAALALHCASRPWNEITAWTVNMVDLHAVLFATGNSESGDIVGHVLTEDAKSGDHNSFHSEILHNRLPHRRSAVQFDGADFFKGVEHLYRQSEQRPARLFRYSDEDIVMVTAQPDCDLAWLEALTDESIRHLDQSATLALLEKRRYHFRCGCTQARLLDALKPIIKTDPVELFGDSETITITCPRCGRRHRISREAAEAWRGERE